MLAVESDLPIGAAIVKNVTDNKSVITDKNGNFQIAIKVNDVLEFSNADYEPNRFRIENEQEPGFYVIHLKKYEALEKVISPDLLYKLDSTEYDGTYYTQMNGARKGENNSCPGVSLSYLDGKNRRQWAFQALFKKWQDEKFIDYMFNIEIVKKITNLSDDDLFRFMKDYRPTNEFLRSATEYEVLEYLKKSYQQFSREQGY